MKKVFHDVHRWKKRWYKKLGAEGRDIWNWLLDEVYETYGVWEIDLDDMRGDLGYDVTMDRIRSVFGDRVREFGDEKLFIPGSIIFQYGELSEDCKPHKSVIRELKRLGLYDLYLEELANSLERVSIPSRNKTKNNTNTNKGGLGENSEPSKKPEALAEEIYSRYPRKLGKKDGIVKLVAKFKAGLSRLAADQALDRFLAHHKTKGTGSEYLPYFSTWVGDLDDWLDDNAGQTEDFSKKNDLSWIEEEFNK